MVKFFVYTKSPLVRFWHPLSYMGFKSFFLYYIFIVLGTILPVLIAVAFFTLAERKVMAFIQRRRGPDVVGF